MHKHRPLIGRKDRSTRLNLLNDLVPPACNVNDGVVLVFSRADGDGFGREGLETRVTVVESVRVGDETVVAELAELRRAFVVVASCEVQTVFLRVERDLVGGALDVSFENERIVEVKVELLKRARKDQVRVSGVVLIERERVTNEHCERVLVSTTGATSLLTQTGEGVGKTDCDDCVEATDIDTEFESGGGDDAEELAGKHLLFDATSVLKRRKVSGRKGNGGGRQRTCGL
jgi:hypothetical protein